MTTAINSVYDALNSIYELTGHNPEVNAALQFINDEYTKLRAASSYDKVEDNDESYAKIIHERTHCTVEQAEKLASEIEALPGKVKRLIKSSDLSEIDLEDCEDVSIIRVAKNHESAAKICGKRICDLFTICGEEHKDYRYYLWTFDINIPDRRFFQTI